MDRLETLASPALGNTRLLSFHRLILTGGRAEVATEGHEHVIDVLAGVCNVHVREADGNTHTFAGVGGRSDIFSGRPEMVYIPRDAIYVVEFVGGPFEAGIYAAPATQRSHAAHISQDRGQTGRETSTSAWARTAPPPT